ncbi:MAG: RusA family crossover junction endodeoxyribonuclease [Chitinophagaceae bacterium]
MESISFHVYGLPMPKGSTTTYKGNTIPAGTPASRKRMAEWRTDIRNAAIERMDGMEPSPLPVRLMCEFQLPYPVSSIRKYQMGWLPHTKKPDWDKLARMMCDALTGIVYRDDSQVCYAMVNKVYAWNGKPGADVIVDFIDDETAQAFSSAHLKVMAAMEGLNSE